MLIGQAPWLPEGGWKAVVYDKTDVERRTASTHVGGGTASMLAASAAAKVLFAPAPVVPYTPEPVCERPSFLNTADPR